MSLHWSWLGILVCVCAGLASAQSATDASVQTEPARATELVGSVPDAPVWQRDVWHYVAPETPFFTEERRNLHSAGILQNDGHFALLLLGTPDQGALVSVNVPGADAATELTSDLMMLSGSVLSRKVTEEQLLAVAVPEAGSQTYSFRVAPADLELFMAASQWRVSAGGKTVTMSLKGSRKAIAHAIRKRDEVAAETTASD